MVFTLGKLLWCLFEGVGSISNDPWRATISGPDVQFPNFKKTPPELRSLIIECTAGASEHRELGPEIIKVGSMVLPKNKEATAGGREVIQIAKGWWQRGDCGNGEVFQDARGM